VPGAGKALRADADDDEQQLGPVQAASGDRGPAAATYRAPSAAACVRRPSVHSTSVAGESSQTSGTPAVSHTLPSSATFWPAASLTTPPPGGRQSCTRSCSRRAHRCQWPPEFRGGRHTLTVDPHREYVSQYSLLESSQLSMPVPTTTKKNPTWYTRRISSGQCLRMSVRRERSGLPWW